ncbi:MAG: hypothetical protein KKF65_02440 [Nanoarchaeota archaeon]|nr:hypothetical protein [Nanoarchaeota archaeon]
MTDNFKKPAGDIFEKYRNEITDLHENTHFTVFLCGPSIKKLSELGATLRKNIHETLLSNGFKVFLGEDDGLEELRKKYSANAQSNELKFIENHCNAIILIASSVGAYCELGAFTKHILDSEKDIDFILLIDKEHEGKSSYLNSGPAAIVEHKIGKVFYEELDSYDTKDIIERLKQNRAMFFMDRRGKPLKGK